jgi:DNA-directed RNA polymerase subunit RPC12/RpoP
MERSMYAIRREDHYGHYNEDYTCNQCKEKFDNPLLATLSSHEGVQKYYACPRCLSEVAKIKEKKGASETEKAFARDTARPTIESPRDVGCRHFLGYLKQRPKDSPIPEGCLTCDKMVDCMLH